MAKRAGRSGAGARRGDNRRLPDCVIFAVLGAILTFLGYIGRVFDVFGAKMRIFGVIWGFWGDLGGDCQLSRTDPEIGGLAELDVDLAGVAVDGEEDGYVGLLDAVDEEA